MKAQNNNFNHRNTLDMSLEKKHKVDLGLSLPEDYFAKSKQSIIKQTINQSNKKVINFSRAIYIGSAVAVIALIITLTVANPFQSQHKVIESDILITSIMTDDANADKLVDEFVNEEMLTEEIFLE
ncbi:hypothetical protein ACQY1Q_03055 [Tenacibaculum sp. TC6]|uniref:hypothetical protein n=1 Tax=Tenacibaculum sp. TC6 TaxID=3423223 RepID=UPI003D36E9FA